MKLYVKSKVSPSRKIYLRVKALTRQGLAKKLGKSAFTIRGYKYSVNEVYAESESSGTATGALAGSLFGLIGGPIGFIIGGLTGGTIGNSVESKEVDAVRRFNKSRYEKKR
jgi:hypothetical protein